MALNNELNWGVIDTRLFRLGIALHCIKNKQLHEPRLNSRTDVFFSIFWFRSHAIHPLFHPVDSYAVYLLNSFVFCATKKMWFSKVVTSCVKVSPALFKFTENNNSWFNSTRHSHTHDYFGLFMRRLRTLVWHGRNNILSLYLPCFHLSIIFCASAFITIEN